MSLIAILEGNIKSEYQKDWYSFLSLEKYLVEMNFSWLDLSIDNEKMSLLGKGALILDGNKYFISLSYSPYYPFRFDRIYINNSNIKYDNNVHLYRDMSLCLYHPNLDKSPFKTIPLFKMIPWITEWITFYELWKKYGLWFGKEIKH